MEEIPFKTMIFSDTECELLQRLFTRLFKEGNASINMFSLNEQAHLLDMAGQLNDAKNDVRF